MSIGREGGFNLTRRSRHRRMAYWGCGTLSKLCPKTPFFLGSMSLSQNPSLSVYAELLDLEEFKYRF
jgi:hypothetical protein